MDKRINFYGAILICLILLMIGVNAYTPPTSVNVTDSVKIDSKIIDKGIYTWNISFEFVRLGSAKSLNTFLKTRKVTYPKKQLELCMQKRNETYCKKLADKQMTTWKNNIIKQEEELLKKIRK